VIQFWLSWSVAPLIQMHEYWKLILGFQNHAPLVHAEIVSSSRDYKPLIYSVLLNLLSMDAGGFFFNKT
jgi:hypothetical protein